MGHVCVCIYGVCVGLAKAEKCIKGQERVQCQRRDPRESKGEMQSERDADWFPAVRRRKGEVNSALSGTSFMSGMPGCRCLLCASC